MNRILSLCLALAAVLSAAAQGYNVSRTVPTATDLVSAPPETFASSPTFGSTNFLSYVETTGDTVSGSGKKTWWWSPTSTLATNTAVNRGPIAYPFGSTAGRWLYVPESEGAMLSSSGVAGQFPVSTGASSLAASGFTTNALRNVMRVVLTSAELVADTPTNLMAIPGGTSAVVQTTGDTVGGSGIRTWAWNAASTAVTNTAAAGGPIAYPYGASTGRWEQVPTAGMLAPTDRVMAIPALYADDSTGTMNATDPAPTIQAYYDAASAAYDPYLGKVRVLHPAGQYTGGELVFKKNVLYWYPHVWHYRKRLQPSGTTQRSVATTARLGGATLDGTDGAFLNWNASGGTNNYFAAADNWYGLSGGMEFGGEGKAIFDQNQKDLTQPLLRLLEVEDMLVSTPGVIECWLSVSTNGSPSSSYAIQLCGRRVIWNCPIIRGGTVVAQDGLHIGWGNNIIINGGYSQSGDDSLAFQAEASGGSTLPPDEPLENVYVSNWNCNTLRARAAIIHAGVNWITAPYTNRTVEHRNVVVNGITGYCSKERQSAIQMGNWQDASGIWTYTIDNPGNGYTDGYYTLNLGAVGGGSGAQCSVKVVGGQITRAVMAKVSGVWKPGTGYVQDQAVTITGMGAGSGGAVTGIAFGAPNNRVVGCAIRNFHLVSGGVTHDGVEPYAIRLHGATDSEIGPGYISVIENTNSPAHRPLFIEAAQDCTIRGVTIVASTSAGLQNGGSINVTKARSVVDGLRVVDSKWGPIRNAGNGLMKVNGTTVGKISFERDRFVIGTGMSGFYMVDYESSKTCYTTNLNIESCEFTPVLGATSTQAVNFVPNAGGSGLVCGMFRFVGNEVTGITTFDSASVLQTACTAYEIRDNRGGYRTKLQTQVTQTSGSTTVSVPVSTYTGLIDATTASLPQIVGIVPVDYLGNWRLRANSTTAATLETASAPSSNVLWNITIDTSRKPLTGY